MHILNLLLIHYVPQWASTSACFSFPLCKNTVSKKYFSSWRRKQIRGGGVGDGDFTRYHWKSWEWCLLAADAIYVKVLWLLRWGQDREAAVVVAGKLCGMRGQWSKPEMRFCQDLPSQKRHLQHLYHPPLLLRSSVAACAKALKTGTASTLWEELQPEFSNYWKRNEKMSDETLEQRWGKAGGRGGRSLKTAGL